VTKRAHVPMRAMRLACLAGPAVVLLSGAVLAFDTTKLGQGGSLGLDEMVPLIEKSAALKREVVEAVARSGRKLDDIRCDGQRFPGQWRNLGGERVSPYVCKIADKWLEVRATVRISGRGKAFETITPEAMRSATTVTEANPTWRWLDHEPN
jgi:hypothetical protein